MAHRSVTQQQDYSILREAELYPLQDIRLDLLTGTHYLQSAQSCDALLDGHTVSVNERLHTQDQGGLQPLYEHDSLDNLQDTDETCPLCGHEVVTKNKGKNKPDLLAILFPRFAGFLIKHRNRFNDRLRCSRYHGWRMGVLFGSCTSALVLCCNIALVVIGYNRSGGYDEDGIANLMHGDGAMITRWNTVLHLFINMLSSILLASSNYTMQVLSSPTRSEIDRAHHQGDWLEVGILSTRNLPKISRIRAVLCITLALSSIPLHLFYNAATFKVIASNDYQVSAIDRQSAEYQDKLHDNGSYTFMEDGTWKSAYEGQFVSGHSDLYLVIDQVVVKTTRTTALSMSDYLPWSTKLNFRDVTESMTATDWIPYYLGSGPLPRSNSNFTAPESMHVISAFAKQTSSQSRLQISFQYMIVVIAFNTLKLCIMVSVLIGIRSKHIVTLGDASASFLERPDPITEGSFPQDSQGNNSCQIKVRLPRVKPPLNDGAIFFYTQTTTFARNIPYSDLIRTDKTAIFFMSMACLTVVLTVFAAVTDFESTNSWAWGTSSEASIMIGDASNSGGVAVFNAWVANFPQVLLSLCYINLNTLCTAMASAHEWNRLGRSGERKGLRVTEPRGLQRGTYFLQLPYRFALPLIAVSALLHWLLSQSFFLVRIDYFDRDGNNQTDASKSSCGVSHSSLVTFFAVGVSLYAVVRLVGLVSMVPRLPPIGSSSLMISAACHPPADEVEPHLSNVSWRLITQKHPPFSTYYSLSGDVTIGLPTDKRRLDTRQPEVLQKGMQNTMSSVSFNPGVGLGS